MKAGGKRERAIVIGASIAGLLTARVLSEHYSQVVVLERDGLASGAQPRRGVPQGGHTHVLLASGTRALERLFPGISDELAGAGATRGDVAERVRWFMEGACLRRFTSGFDGLGMTRLLLEATLRARVLRLPSVVAVPARGIDGLVVTADRSRVTGVTAGTEAAYADLIVDASGRGSRTPGWLKRLGYARPPEERVVVELRYTTRVFKCRPGDLDGDDAAIIPPTPAGKRGGAMVRQEGERWIVTLMTLFGDFAPPELAGFVDFARTLPAPYIYDVIRDAVPLGEPQTIRIPASVRHHYERLTSFPRGYLVIGDAISSFNPIYGQGMSVAALEAELLGRLLAGERRINARRFFRGAAKIVDGAWAVAVGNDLRVPEVVGERNPGMVLQNWYVERLLRAAHADARPARAFLRVSNLLAPPRTLMHPALIRSALRARRIQLDCCAD